MEQFLEFCFQNFPHDLPGDEGKNAVDDHLYFKIFPTSFGISRIYQLYNAKF